MEKARKYIVACPPDKVTGGTELLHQLVHNLRLHGKEAYICYVPFKKEHIQPAAFAKYDTPQISLQDGEDITLIFPEVFSGHSLKFKKAKNYIWWLAVDSKNMSPRKNFFSDTWRFIKTLGKRKVPVFRLKNAIHLVQSDYARIELEKAGIKSTFLTDYLNDDYLSAFQSNERKNVILYNPKKGIERTQKLMKAYPELTFFPLQGFTNKQLLEHFRTSKLYIDFGTHPGKDRIPREAVISGCCLITNKRGSAFNAHDVPIASHYKFNDEKDEFIKEFGVIVTSIFNDFDRHSSEYGDYRDKIQGEKEAFIAQMKASFF